MRKNLIPTGYHGEYGLDGQHYIDTSVIFEDGAELHIFRNHGGCRYAAIYYKGEEVYSHEISHCDDMVSYYKKHDMKKNINIKRTNKPDIEDVCVYLTSGQADRERASYAKGYDAGYKDGQREAAKK